MASRMADCEALAKRCEAVGWPVEGPDSKGYKVWPPGATRPIPIHLTPSDVRGFANLEARLMRAGLKEAEEAVKQRRSKTKAEVLADQRAKAETKAKELAQQETAIAKASGPYAVPEYVEDEWFLFKHPAPWVRACIITPDQAQRLLASNTDNRGRKPDRIRDYRRILENGRWLWVHQGMAWDTRGVLQDGQNRLEAIAESGVEAIAFCFVGMSPENFAVIDEGAPRTASDVLKKQFKARYATNTAAAIRLVHAYRHPKPRDAMTERISNETVVREFAGDGEALIEAVLWSSRYRRTRYNLDFLSCPATGPAAAHYLLYQRNGADNLYVEAFLYGLATGMKDPVSRVNLDGDDPRYNARRYFINARQDKRRLPPLDVLSIILLAWNSVVADKRARFIRWDPDTMPIPGVAVCRPDQSAVPPLLADYVQSKEIDGD